MSGLRVGRRLDFRFGRGYPNHMVWLGETQVDECLAMPVERLQRVPK
jgi:hypothetical protein